MKNLKPFTTAFIVLAVVALTSCATNKKAGKRPPVSNYPTLRPY